MRIQYVEKERADKSNRIELKELQIKVSLIKFAKIFYLEIHLETFIAAKFLTNYNPYGSGSGKLYIPT